VGSRFGPPPGLPRLQALATTSGGFAATLGRFDGSVTAEEALGHAAAVVAATHLPVSADLEDAFARDPGGVATTVTRAAAIGLAGCSVEDFTRQADEPIYDLGLAVERVAAAAEVAHGGSCPLVLTARTERHLHGASDLAATVDRLQHFADAGADVVFAPGVIDLLDVARLVSELDRPVNVLVTRGAPPVAALAGVGSLVSRSEAGWPSPPSAPPSTPPASSSNRAPMAGSRPPPWAARLPRWPSVRHRRWPSVASPWAIPKAEGRSRVGLGSVAGRSRVDPDLGAPAVGCRGGAGGVRVPAGCGRWGCGRWGARVRVTLRTL